MYTTISDIQLKIFMDAITQVGDNDNTAQYR